MQKKHNHLYASLDLETVWQKKLGDFSKYNIPYKPKEKSKDDSIWEGAIVVPYAIGIVINNKDQWLRCTNDKNPQGFNEPLQFDNSIHPILGNPLKTWFGSNAVLKFFFWLDNVANYYNKITIFVHNAEYDVNFLIRDLYILNGQIPEINKKNYLPFQILRINKKSAGMKKFICCVIKLKNSKRKTFTVIFKCTYLFNNLSYRDSIKGFKDEQGKSLDKGNIEYEKRNMEFNSDGSIKGYYKKNNEKTYETVKKHKTKKGLLISTDIMEWVEWTAEIAEIEKKYLENDLKGLPLLVIDQMRERKTTLNVLEINANYDDKISLLKSPTTGGLHKRALSLCVKYSEKWKNDSFVKNLITRGTSVFDSLYRFPITEYEYTEHIKSCSGGFVSYTDIFNWNAKNNEYGVCLDVNSEYPAICSKGLPTGEPTCYKPEGIEGVDYAVWLYVIPKKKYSKNKKKYICQCPVPKSWNPFKTTPIGKSYLRSLNCILKCQVEEKQGLYIWGHMLNMINKGWDWDYEIDNYKTLYFQLLPVTAEYIEKQQYIKKTNSQKRNPQEEKAYKSSKVGQNCIYGKGCEKRHEDTKFFSEKEKGYVDLEKWMSENPSYIEEPYNSLAMGSYVATTGKCLILNVCFSVIEKGGKVFYTDTDSIMCILPKTQLDILIDSNELGAFKCEGLFSSYRSNGKNKKYALFNQNKELLPKNEKEFEEFKQKRLPKWFWPFIKWNENIFVTKIAASGFPNKKIVHIAKKEPSFIDLLFDIKNNVCILDASNEVRYDTRFKTALITSRDCCFNVENDLDYDNDGNNINRGADDITHICYFLGNSDNPKIVIKNSDQIEKYE